MSESSSSILHIQQSVSQCQNPLRVYYIYSSRSVSVRILFEHTTYTAVGQSVSESSSSILQQSVSQCQNPLRVYYNSRSVNVRILFEYTTVVGQCSPQPWQPSPIYIETSFTIMEKSKLAQPNPLPNPVMSQVLSSLSSILNINNNVQCKQPPASRENPPEFSYKVKIINPNKKVM